jgi:hypothetical protein
MSAERSVVIVGRSPDLDLALDALAELDLAIRVIPTPLEAERALLGARPPQVGAVLVSLEGVPSQGLRLIRALRRRGEMTTTPIAVWVPPEGAHLLPEAYRAGASSGVVLVGPDGDAIRLAQMIHYWAVANHPPLHEAAV